MHYLMPRIGTLRSLSARRAWIEIIGLTYDGLIASVALRKESVDRNIPRGQLPTPEPPSLSARRAWIEIMLYDTTALMKCVALRKESVDRNKRRVVGQCVQLRSLSARRAWIEMSKL